MNELLQQFLIESRELAQEATEGLLALERAPHDAGLLDAVFRSLHTLKGGAGIVDFVAMERAVHAAEDVLSAARAGRLVLTAEVIGACLACLDQVLQWLDTLEQTDDLPMLGSVGQAERAIARFGAAATAPVGVDRREAPATATRRAPASNTLSPHARAVLEAQCEVARQSTTWGHLASAALAAANVLQSQGRDAEAEQLALLASPGNAADLSSALGEILLRVLTDGSKSTNAAEVSASPTSGPQGAMASRTLRVDAGRIDALVRLTGEFTVAKNALAHLSRLASGDGNALSQALKLQHAVLDHLVGELQQAVLALRVLPIRIVFQRFPKLVREMSEALGKQVELKISGEDTEADKAIIEMLFEPLLHLVRNALDHGVEEAALRATRAKPPIATIGMRARREGSQVVIEISDDGSGMDPQQIGRAAVERGVVAAEVLDTLGDAEILELVFATGLSTAASVTAISGRGVGMDAVRAAVERIGGRVSVNSAAGRGTTIRCTLPFSVMMTMVMSVEAGGQMFGVPLDAVVETIRVPRSSITAIGSARAIVLRDQTIPVLSLGQILGADRVPADSGDATIVIAGFAGQHCGLAIDALGERLEIILKPLDGLLTGTPGISGTTLLGDGRVLLVLDVAELLQ